MQLVSAFLAYPFLINHLLYESLVPLAFVVGHPSFDLFFFGLGRNLPHLLVRQQLKAFLKIHEERRLPTLHPTPTSLAFAFRGHMASTSATHVTRTVEWRTPFLYLFFFRGVDHVHALGHGHGHVFGVVGRVADLGWTFGWRCGAQKVALPLLRRLWSQYWYA